MSSPTNVLGADQFDGAWRQRVQDALDELYGLIQASRGGGAQAGAASTTIDELRVRLLTVVGSIDVVPPDKPPANAFANLVLPWLTAQRGRPLVLRYEDQNDGGDLLEWRFQPYTIGTPTATTGAWELRAYTAQRDPAGAYRSAGALVLHEDGRLQLFDATEVEIFDTDDLGSAVDDFPPRHVSGLVIRYASSSTITVSAGSARNKADTANMTLVAGVTVDKASANAALGYERKTLTGTHTMNFGTGIVTGSGSAYLTEFGTRALSAGTVTNAVSTLTGTGTKFLSEVAVNDLIGNNASGYYRVTAVASDTSLTLAGYPSAYGPPSTGVDFSGATVNVIEQPVIESAAGKAHGLANIYTNTDLLLGFTTGSATETGVTAYASSKSALDSTSYTCLWRAVWLLSGGSGTTVALSTQRTTPYLSITGYTTSYRRIGWVRIDSSGNVLPTYSTDGGGVRTVDYESNSSATEQSIASNLALTTSWQTLLAGASVPPTSRRVILAVQLVDPNTVGYTILRGRNLGNAGASVANYRACGPPTSTSTRVFNTVLVPCDGAQAIEVGSNANTGDGSYIAVLGYEDTLE